MSRLAVASVVCSVVACCPFTSVIGAILGIRALWVIRAAGGRLRGRTLARIGLALGVAGSVMQVIVMSRYDAAMMAHLEQESYDALATTFADPAIAARDHWVAAAGTPRHLEPLLRAFVDEATGRYGAFQRLSFSAAFDRNPADNLEWIVPVHLVFENGDVPGGAVVRFEFDRITLLPPVRLSRLTLIDPVRGDLQAPARDAAD